MFGFFKKRMAKEHLKLVYQNTQAVAFIRAFDPDLADSTEHQLNLLLASWEPGELISNDLLTALLEANRSLRTAYDTTPARYAKSFDEAFQPMLGWKEYYSDYVR